MFPNRPPAPNVSNSQFNYSITETLDRIKEEFSFVQQQYHSLHLEREKLLGERSDMQRICVMYYEMANGLNLEMHRQMEIAKRLNAILTQVMPFLSQEHQTQVASAIDRAKQVSMQELNTVLAAQMEDSKGGMSKFSNGSNSDNLELYKQGMNHHGSNNNSNPSLSAALLNGFMSGSSGVSTSNSNNPASFMMPPPVSSPANRDSDKFDDKQRAALAAASAASNLLFPGSSNTVGPLNTNANSSGNQPNSVAAVAAALGVPLPQSTQSQLNNSGASSPRSTTSSSGGPPSSKPQNNNSQSINSALAAVAASGIFNNPQGPLGPAQAAALAAVAGLNPNSMPGLAAAAVASMRQGNASPSGSTGPHEEKRRRLMGEKDKSGRRSGGEFSPQNGSGGYPTTSSAPAVGSSRGLNDSRNKHSTKHISNICNGPGAYSFIGPDDMKKPCTIASHPKAITGPNVPKRLQHLASLPHGDVVCAVTLGSQPIGRLQGTSSEGSTSSSAPQNLPHFAYTGGKGCVKLWDLGQVYEQHQSQMNSSGSAFINNRVLDNSMPISTFDCLKQNSYVRSIKLLPDASGLVIGGESDSLTIWDLGESCQRKADLKFDAPACYALALSNDGKLCFSCCSLGKVTMWDIHNQLVVGQFLAHADGASCIQVGPNENTLWTGGLDSAVKCWDIRANPSAEELHKISFKSQVFSLGLWNTQHLKRNTASSPALQRNGSHDANSSPSNNTDDQNNEENDNNSESNNGKDEDKINPPDVSNDKDLESSSSTPLDPSDPYYAVRNMSTLSDHWLAVGLETSEVEVVAVGSQGPFVPTSISKLDPGFVSTAPRHFRLTHHESCVLALKFAHKSDWFITTGKDHQVNAWRSPYGACLLETKEAASVLTCDISMDDKFIVTGSGDKRANLYEVIYN